MVRVLGWRKAVWVAVAVGSRAPLRSRRQWWVWTSVLFLGFVLVAGSPRGVNRWWCGRKDLVHYEVSGNVQGSVLQARDIYLRSSGLTALSGLPPVVGGFTGRDEDLSTVAEALHSPRPVVVSTIVGLAGVGKTTLAVKAAHNAREAGLFPGGVLFIDLQGYSPQTRVEPPTALSVFLHALGVPADQVPAEQAAREALYRTRLADHDAPLLIVLDNASSEDQVRPLLPPGAAHRVLITSRHTLSGLRGARRIPLDVLSVDESVTMVDDNLRAADPTDTRIHTDLGAKHEIARLCGRLPLALTIVSAMLSDDPDLPLAEVAGTLRDATTRLGELSQHDDLAMRAAFALSYARLRAAEARLFRLMSLNPGRQVSAEAAAALGDLTPQETRKLLTGLRRANMIDGGEPRGWFRFHDLLRLYAADRVAAEEPDDARRAAIRRLIDFYVATTEAAERDRSSVETRRQAHAWLETERPNLVGAIALAHQQGHYELVLRLAFAMGTFLFYRRRRGEDGLTSYQLALDSALRRGDRYSEAKVLRGLGRIHREMNHPDAAAEQFAAAAAISRTIGDHRGQARASHSLGSIHRRAGRFDAAWEQYRRALTAFRTAGDPAGESQIHFSMGTLARNDQEPDTALDHYHTSLEISRRIGRHDLEGRALRRLALMAEDRGDATTARRYLDAAVTAYTTAGDHHRAGRYRAQLRSEDS
ncbi:tetratricopeptide repeat protein [Actinokineospora sp. PR83]|uniref:ATP-binding protein n=1 Tax=Actinokineospora sp. PR83 TaxID=2884908 RepID=UPI001F1FF20A|nr:tetratricopeptide repeat protein [Actinokineospora sp. PR83]MCG8919530.1 tetratricopeptide repeat protein [Actinokineospora sp. PR83]